MITDSMPWYFTLILLLLKLSVFSQSTSAQFIPPLEIKLYLSGSFAELRSNHFHSGIDIKTQGVCGKSVHSIEKGWISRIKIQTNGYGKSIYVNHPGGYTSVYGHLSAYNEKIDQYVKNYQYSNKVHTLDIYPSQNELLVNRGDVIGYSGNTGSSGGPHLHFEIRDSKNQHPLNPMRFPFNIQDNVEPRISNFYLYSFDGDGDRRKISARRKLGLQLEKSSYSLKAGDTITTPAQCSFGLEAYDFMNGTSNRYGLYSLKMLVDEELVFHFKANEFSFSESKFINAYIDYVLKETAHEKVQLLFHKPNNKLSMSGFHHDGIIKLLPGETKHVLIELADISGNVRSLSFYVRAEAHEQNSKYSTNQSIEKTMEWDKPYSFQNHLIRLNMAANSLYEDAPFSFVRIEKAASMHPYIHRINNPGIPLHIPAVLSIKPEGIPERLLNKTCLIYLDENNQPEYRGGSVDKSGWITGKINVFGNFSLEPDTLAPAIVPLFNQGKPLQPEDELTFMIQDNLSGIKSYRGFINNQWVLFEYDPKNNLLIHHPDKKRTPSAKNLEIEVYVEDNIGNEAAYHGSFAVN